MQKSYIAAILLSYNLPDNNLLFKALSFDLAYGEKTALIGDNGVGKTTLLKIIQGELTPSSGVIKRHAKIAIIPQNVQEIKGTILEVLGIGEIICALQRISRGEAFESDWEIVGNNWDLEDRLETQLKTWNLEFVKLDQDFAVLSGGEKEKILIIRAILDNADIILLDEPTNNLDYNSRKFLIEQLFALPQGILVISHDRMLLNEVSEIWEMTANGIKKYGGNYEFYKAQKIIEKQNKEAEVSNLEQLNKQLFTQKIGAEQKKSRANAYGDKMVENRKYSRLDAGLRKSQAERTAAKKNQILEEKMEKTKAELYDKRLELKEEIIKIPVPDKPFIREKLLEIKEMSFSFGERHLFENFNLVMKGDERVAINGDNGSGKTTLLKLILGDLQADFGTINLNGRAVYLNQDLSLLNKKLNSIEAVLESNPSINNHEARRTLANFKFRNTAAEKKVSVLSGGELLRACLASIFCTSNQPDLIILDEPTNNLDIKSVEILENALVQYKGALLVVSHDKDFLARIGITKNINL